MEKAAPFDSIILADPRLNDAQRKQLQEFADRQAAAGLPPGAP